MKRLLLIALIASNLFWFIQYRRLWLDAAQAEGLLDEAEHYIAMHGGAR
jgi:hypothetical protein